MENFEIKSKNPGRDATAPEERIGGVHEMLIVAHDKVIKTSGEILEKLRRLDKMREEENAATDPDYVRKLTEAVAETEKEIKELKDFRSAQEEGKKTLEKILEELVVKHVEAKKTLLAIQKERSN